jgi:hypothetical protein
MPGVVFSLWLGPSVGAAAATGSARTEVGDSLPWALLVVTALLAGATLQLTRLSIGPGRLRALRRRAQPAELPPWLDRLRSDLAPRARFVVAGWAPGPATFGVFGAAIVLPRSFPWMSLERQRAVALHELIHARRKDGLMLLGEEIVKAVLFFHPAVHWLVARVRLAREQCVDGEVVRFLGGRRAYLETLVEVARLAARADAVPAALFLRERHLRERVELLLKEVPMSRLRTLTHLGLLAGALVLTGVLAVAAFPLAAASSPASSDAAVSTPSQTPAPPEQGFQPPKKIVHVDPAYPADVKEEGAQGIFVLVAAIDPQGRVSDARVIVSSPSLEPGQSLLEKRGTSDALRGDPRLAAAAVEAVRQWRYEPPLGEDGQPKTFAFVATVTFALS